ncbi:MAG: YbaB/EbfC family nucleoid-associated protein [Phycisphaerae bacterium]
MAGLGDLVGMMKDLGGLKKRVAELQEELANKRVEGSAGAGKVLATVNGRGELLGLKIDPEVVAPDETELLEDMVKAAVRQAVDKARDIQREEMSKLLGGIPLPPGLADLLA